MHSSANNVISTNFASRLLKTNFNMQEIESKLFADFAPVSTEEWEAKINADLKGQDYERALVWRTYEGFNIRPYYRNENLKKLKYLDMLPGEFPFVRGTKNNNNDWFVRQDIFVKNFANANKKALSVLGKGITSLGFYFDCIHKITKADLHILLKDISLEAAEINFVCGCENCNCAFEFAEYVSQQNLNKENVIASSAIDPIATFILKGKLEAGTFENLKTVICQQWFINCSGTGIFAGTRS